jgi:hypothetical protein
VNQRIVGVAALALPKMSQTSYLIEYSHILAELPILIFKFILEYSYQWEYATGFKRFNSF